MESEFYTAEEILSKKFKKGFFGYKETQEYSAFGYTLFNIVFDMTELGKNPIKLIRSILLNMKTNELILMNIDNILFKTFLFDVRYDIQDWFSPERKIAGLIRVLEKYKFNDNKIERVTMTLLSEFLGAKYYKFKDYPYKTCRHRGEYIFDSKFLKSEPFNDFLKWYEKKTEVFNLYIEYCNAINKRKYKKLTNLYHTK